MPKKLDARRPSAASGYPATYAQVYHVVLEQLGELDIPVSSRSEGMALRADLYKYRTAIGEENEELWKKFCGVVIKEPFKNEDGTWILPVARKATRFQEAVALALSSVGVEAMAGTPDSHDDEDTGTLNLDDWDD